MGSTNFCRFRDQNSHRFRDQGSNFWVKIWDQLQKNILRYDPDMWELSAHLQLSLSYRLQREAWVSVI